MNNQLTISDLPDLSAWHIAPILSLEQAALLWGGIDPAYTDFSTLNQEHPEKVRITRIALQAFIGGICLGTLTPHVLYLFDDRGGSYPENPKQPFTISDVDIKNTLVMRDVLIKWAQRESVKSIRNMIREKDKLNAILPVYTPAAEPPVRIEHKPLEPIHETPEFKAACIVIKNKWNAISKDDIPPKEAEMQEYIRTTLREITGKEPSAAAVNRVDTLTRPDVFKNRKTPK